MIYLGEIARLIALLAGLGSEAPWLSDVDVVEQVTAAVGAETDDAPAELMLAMAWRESRYTNASKPQCGVLQVHLPPARCRVARASAAGGYAAGAGALGAWSDYCRRVRRSKGVSVTRCALNGYAEGGLAGRRGWGVKGCRRHRHCDRAAGPLGRARRIAAGVVTPAATS